jgi:small nuclear ribonucleoprotein D3
VFVRGSQVRFIVIPDMLKNSPMFKRIANQAKKGKNALLNKGKQVPSTAPPIVL